MSNRVKVSARIVVAVAAVMIFVCWAAAFIWSSSVPLNEGGRVFCLFDDAMISMRYADNLAHGHGPVWNPGERVEGYTNPLMVAEMAVLLSVLPKPLAVLTVQIFGALAVVAIALLSARVYRSIAGERRRLPAWVVLALVFGTYTLSYWSIMGMETSLVGLFLSLGVVVVLLPADHLGSSARRSVLLGIIGAGLYLSRPDALVYALVLVGFDWLTCSRRRLSRLALPALPIAAVVGAHLVFRLAYYGTLVPNTATLKLGDFPLGVRLLGGIGYVRPFMWLVLPLLLLAMASFLTGRDRRKGLILSLFGVSVLYQIYVGGDPWAYWRIMSPTLPLLVVLAADGAVVLTSRVRVLGSRRLASLAVATSVVFIALLLYDRPFLGELLLIQPPYDTPANVQQVNIAYAIKDLTRPSASTAVYRAGTVPFYSERYAIDCLGKSDPHIARLLPDLSGAASWNGMMSVPGHNKYDLQYSIVEKRPTYVARTWWLGDDISGWAASRYVTVTHMGVELMLAKDSGDVFWDKVEDSPE